MKKNILLEAKKHHYAIGAFNVNTYDEMIAIAEAAAQAGQPVILMASMSSARFFTPEIFAGLVKVLNEHYPIEIFSHLDHCTQPELLIECAQSGFDSVMYDGSHTPYKENVAVTKELADICHQHHVYLEGELGIIYGEAVPVKSTYSEFTVPECAAEFIHKTEVDSLAVSIGNQHGFYKGNPKLNFPLLKELNQICPTPLVLHGGTGIPQADIIKAIQLGICKVNVGTEIRASYIKALIDYTRKHHDDADIRPFVKYLRTAVQQASEKYMYVFHQSK